jgi:hypothetical protein
MVSVSESTGEPLSATFTVMLKVPVAVGVQEKLPVVEPMVAPAGGVTSEKVFVWPASGSVAEAVKVRGLAFGYALAADGRQYRGVVDTRNRDGNRGGSRRDAAHRDYEGERITAAVVGEGRVGAGRARAGKLAVPGARTML